MSDRLVVMNAGRIEQLDSPREMYEHPKTRFVAGFIGTSNLLTLPVKALDGTTAVLDVGADQHLVVPDAVGPGGAVVGGKLDITVRPEKIVVSKAEPDAGHCALRGLITELVYLGTATQYAVTTPVGDLLVFLQNASDSSSVAERGEPVWLSWHPEHSLALASSGTAATEKEQA
jgi:spermidine/putrescine transport system ATP-binding protein